MYRVMHSEGKLTKLSCSRFCIIVLCHDSSAIFKEHNHGGKDVLPQKTHLKLVREPCCRFRERGSFGLRGVRTGAMDNK